VKVHDFTVDRIIEPAMIGRQLLRGRVSPSRRHISFSTSARHNLYEDTISNLKIGKHTRVIFQGFTGMFLIVLLMAVINSGARKTSEFIIRTSGSRLLSSWEATVNAKESIEWGTGIVGGVTPGKNDVHLGLPVLPTVREVCV
jgi:succinyl-CoA synthetase alpha subunit